MVDMEVLYCSEVSSYLLAREPQTHSTIQGTGFMNTAIIDKDKDRREGKCRRFGGQNCFNSLPRKLFCTRMI